jgi:hypothetical protein
VSVQTLDALVRAAEAAEAQYAAQAEFKLAVIAAVDAGVAASRIAETVGLSRQRVWQIANDR